MKRSPIIGVLGLIAILAGCSEEPATTPSNSSSPPDAFPVIDPEPIANELVRQAGWPSETVGTDEGGLERPLPVYGLDREVLVGDIVHYRAEIRVGPGAYDIIGIHRVVREDRPYRPIRTDESVFLVHGDLAAFEAAFLPGVGSPNTPVDRSFAVYLAQNDVDVWGIDLSWSFVPSGTTDFSFMADWGTEHDACQVTAGVGIARFSRAVTGNGMRKMILLGYSAGSYTGYAVINQDAVLPPGLRQLSGFIPVDLIVKTDDEEIRQAACEEAVEMQAQIDSGVYHANSGELGILIGTLARTAPDEPSPIIPGLTNYQAALFIGANTYILSGGFPFHFVAGVFDDHGATVDLRYTPVESWLDFLLSFSPYIALRHDLERQITRCDEVDVPWDDHYPDVTIPILHVGAGGGRAEAGAYATSLLGSTDVTTLIVSQFPPDQALLDFGHTDLFSAEDAPMLVWEPIRAWVAAH